MKKNNRYIIAGVIAVIALLIVIVRAPTSPEAARKSAQNYANQQNVSFSVLIPTYFPAASAFKPSQSNFMDGSTHIMCLSWVYPAQTLPGQGTLTICEQPIKEDVVLENVKDGRSAVFEAMGKQRTASIGVLNRGLVPDQPGQRLLRATVEELNISIVAYAITDEELLKIAASLQP